MQTGQPGEHAPYQRLLERLPCSPGVEECSQLDHDGPPLRHASIYQAVPIQAKGCLHSHRQNLIKLA